VPEPVIGMDVCIKHRDYNRIREYLLISSSSRDDEAKLNTQRFDDSSLSSLK